MALTTTTMTTTTTSANGAALSREQENKLLDELFALQLAIVEGKRSEYQLSAATLKQLQATIARAPRDTSVAEQPRAAPQTIPGYTRAITTTSSGLDPIFLEKSDSLIRAEGRLKRQRIERELFEQVERRKHTAAERDGQASTLDVDNVLAKAQALVPPVTGLRTAVAVAHDDKSSFDENDYYSSQVESDWSADGVPVGAAKTAFTADFERFDEPVTGAKKRHARNIKPSKATDPAGRNDILVGQEEGDDEYIPEEPSAGHDSYTDLGQPSPPNIGEASDYEPGEVSQNSDDYTPEYAPPPVAESPQTRVHNQLTQIAAPQPNRVSPLAVHKNQNYELELVNGRPEVVHKARSRYDTDHARQSSASPPVNSGTRSSKRQKSKKRKREADQPGRAKKRDRRLGLDTSAQYPQVAIKDEPFSPAQYPSTEPPRYEYRLVETAQSELPGQFQQPITQYYAAPPIPQRASSVMTQRVVPREEQDLRRVATLRHAEPPHVVEYRPYSPVAPYAAANRPQSVMMGPPPPRLQENIPPEPHSFMPPPPAPAPKHVVVDQYGNRYYAAEPEPAPIRASVAPESHPSQFERAPSRMATVSTQYDPANPRIEHIQPSTRMAAPPSYALDTGDRMHKVRGHTQAPEPRHYTVEPTSPVFQRPVQYEQPYGVRPAQTYDGMPPPAFHIVDPGRQSMAPPPQIYSQDGVQLVQAGSRAYSVQPEFVQQMPVAFPPRQGSVAPVQYIRQSVQPEQNVRYIDARGYEVQPSQVRQVSEYRQY